MRYALLLLALVTTAASSSVPEALWIPRSLSKSYRTEGIFEGGAEVRANIEALRLASHEGEGFERWVFDFSDAKNRAMGTVAPRFQLHYVKGERHPKDDGGEIVLRHPKFVLLLRAIKKSYLKHAFLDRLAAKSRFVTRIVAYPPIEDGDMAIELVLNEEIVFEPHQPIEREGRLVLDVKEVTRTP